MKIVIIFFQDKILRLISMVYHISNWVLNRRGNLSEGNCSHVIFVFSQGKLFAFPFFECSFLCQKGENWYELGETKAVAQALNIFKSGLKILHSEVFNLIKGIHL